MFEILDKTKNFAWKKSVMVAYNNPIIIKPPLSSLLNSLKFEPNYWTSMEAGSDV